MHPNTRNSALAAHLECEIEAVTESEYDETVLECGNKSFLVLTDDEANSAAATYIKETLWAFNPSFLAGYTLDMIDPDMLKMLQTNGEDANPALLRLVGPRIDKLIKDAVSADGRGHFIGAYDNDEHEVNDFFIYRIN